MSEMAASAFREFIMDALHLGLIHTGCLPTSFVRMAGGTSGSEFSFLSHRLHFPFSLFIIFFQPIFHLYYRKVYSIARHNCSSCISLVLQWPQCWLLLS